MPFYGAIQSFLQIDLGLPPCSSAEFARICLKEHNLIGTVWQLAEPQRQSRIDLVANVLDDLPNGPESP